ncbi:putative NAD/FAD-binding protein [Antricoccus suffuscus]|uniref:Putative NAD/FAD-binding protein n=1 Tax=Antricoccus suffuscus TaxID=1629062 RepID=A0A2T1A639_9ACTN|nr:FAD-dependent oxidoreductase [Antricoccus suffuscus]PRZ44060.1 putative NAD/FAD-binding protein [Antricoccus suffuscus]
MTRRRIAVIGSGVAGLTAAYVLQREADVTLYEADSRLGGHAHTHEVLDDSGTSIRVDTGFIVHNERTYPQLIRLFSELDIATADSDMSMSVQCGGCGLQYAGARGLSGLFPSSRNVVNPRYLYLLTEVVRFQRAARALLASDDGANRTVGEFVQAGHFTDYFRSHFLTPLIAAVWSTPPQLTELYPVRYLFEFLQNHGMLSISGSPQWRTVVGGSARYVEKAVKSLSAVLTSTPVRSVARAGAGVTVRDDSDQLAQYDAAVIASHPAQALSMLAAPTDAQSHALGAIGYSKNPTILHTDTAVLPAARKAQASWNYFLPSCTATADSVHVSYDMNRLQNLPTDTRYLVTLNDDGAVRPDAIVERMQYEHPIITPEAVAAQGELAGLNDGVLAFAGAYHGWGFHEDGCRSGVDAARSLGVHW